MPIILSLTYSNSILYASGPEGLFRMAGDQLEAVPQPMTDLTGCIGHSDGIVVGGAPHGVAFTRADGSWQASWMDGVTEPALCFATAPHIDVSGLMLAGTAGGGILRSANRGQSWTVCNYGLQEFTVLTFAWSPVRQTIAWPAWDDVFAGTDNGLYRSLNAGRAWKQSMGVSGVVQAIAVSPAFHTNGQVLAGTEAAGVWRSTDGGRSFSAVSDAPERADALAASGDKWWLGNPDGLWRSSDGVDWELVDASLPALTLLASAQGVWAGGEFGVVLVS